MRAEAANATSSPVKMHKVPSQPLLCEKEVAHLLNCSVATIQRMRYRNAGLKYYKIQKAVKYSHEQVAEYLANAEVTGHEEL